MPVVMLFPKLVQGGVYCIDPSGTGDISSEIDSNSGPVTNPNSKLIWKSTEVEGQALRVSTAGLCVTDDCVFAGDNDGFVRCFGKSNGTLHWSHDAFSNIIGTPLVVGDTLYVADEDGDVEVLSATPAYEHIASMNHGSCFESSPVYANDTLLVVTRQRLFAIGRMPQR